MLLDSFRESSMGYIIGVSVVEENKIAENRPSQVKHILPTISL